MSKLAIKAGSKKETVTIFIQDSSSTTGAGLTGLVFNTANLVASYARQKGARVAVTLATLAAETSAWSSGGFKEIDATNMPGLYRLDLPDASLSAGVRYVTLLLKGAANMATCVLEIDLKAEVTTTAQVATIRSGTAQAGSTSNTIKLDASASATDNLYANNVVAITGGTGVGQTRSIVSYVGSTKVATVDKNWVAALDNTSTFDLYASPGATYSDQGTAQAGGATTITLAATASPTNSVYIGSFVSILSGTGSGQTKTVTAYVGATQVATVDSAWGVNPDSTSAYAVIPAGNVASGSGGSGTIPPTAGEIVTAVLTTAMTESYAADGVAPTLAQAVFMTISFLFERSIVSTILTAKKLDGTTSAMTFTLNSATQPTDQTRTT